MKIIRIILLLFIFTPLISLEVNRSIVDNLSDREIEFDNYYGPYLFYNSVEEIRSIGSYFAKEITPSIKGDSNYSNKYKLFHRPKLEWEENSLSSEVLEITFEALIDNSNNIELIISQYLIENYGYSVEDADLLSHIILIYNAVFRGNGEHYSTSYSTESVLTKDIDSLGIDLHYYNWPGKTFIYIPLSENISFGNLSNIDSDILIDEKVIENIKVEEVDDIELREDIVEFKERELEQIENEIVSSKIELENLSSSEETTNSDVDKIEIITELEKEIEIKEELATSKEEKILELRDELAEDKNNLIEKKDLKPSSNSFKYILNRGEGQEIFGKIVDLSLDGDILNQSLVNSIRNNTFNIKGDDLFILAGGDKRNQIVTLGKLDSRSLELQVWGTVSCYTKSPIIIQGKFIYAIIMIKDSFYIGEFNYDLQLLRKSTTAIYKESFIALKNDVFYIQGINNNIELVNLSDFASE